MIVSSSSSSSCVWASWSYGGHVYSEVVSKAQNTASIKTQSGGVGGWAASWNIQDIAHHVFFCGVPVVTVDEEKLSV